MFLNIKMASELICVSKSTLRRWEKNGKITCYKTPGGHRRYDSDELIKLIIKK